MKKLIICMTLLSLSEVSVQALTFENRTTVPYSVRILYKTQETTFLVSENSKMELPPLVLESIAWGVDHRTVAQCPIDGLKITDSKTIVLSGKFPKFSCTIENQ